MKGPPSRVRSDYGAENNDVEKIMKAYWGEAHNAFLRGRYVIGGSFALFTKLIYFPF